MSLNNISLDKLAECIFVSNLHGFEMSFEINQKQTNKSLAALFYNLFIKGIVLLHGENDRVTLNKLSIEQIYVIRDKLKKAQVHTNVLLYDKPTSILLDYLTTDDKFPEKRVIERNRTEIEQMRDDEPLTDYEYRMFVNDHLICLTFELRNFSTTRSPVCFS